MSERKFLFYNPGMKGAVFNLASKDYITPELVKHTKDHLEYEIKHSVAIQKKEGPEPRPEKSWYSTINTAMG